MNETSVNEQQRQAFPQPQPCTQLTQNCSVSKDVFCPLPSERRILIHFPSYCHTKITMYHSTRVLSVFRGNVTLPRNSINQNKAVFNFPPEGWRRNWTITHVVSLDISNHGRNGAAAYLLRGGIDFTYVSIGYNYIPTYGVIHVVAIYGR